MVQPCADAGSRERARHGIVVPIYEEEITGIYYNTAAVIDADGKYLGKYRKNHIPHVNPGFWEKFYFRPGNLGYPCFDTAFARIGVYICYDRHFPEGARALGLNGAEIVFNPSATVAGLSEYLWRIEQPAHAVANGYFIGAINRVGHEQPWDIGEFYGQSYFCDPRGQFHRRSAARSGRARRCRSRSRQDSRSAQHVAVLPRSPAGYLRRAGRGLKLVQSPMSKVQSPRFGESLNKPQITQTLETWTWLRSKNGSIDHR
jgi:predicted amidohydrolase